MHKAHVVVFKHHEPEASRNNQDVQNTLYFFCPLIKLAGRSPGTTYLKKGRKYLNKEYQSN